MDKDVVCGMQVDPAPARASMREDVLLLLEGLQNKVRHESDPVREIGHTCSAFQAKMTPKRRSGRLKKSGCNELRQRA